MCINKSPFPPATNDWLLLLALVTTLAAGCVNTLTAAAAQDATDTPAGFAKVFFVASNGDDKNPGTSAKPFASITRARDAVRAVAPGMKGDILVQVAPGDYFLSEPIVLRPEDSGRNGHRIVYRGGGEPGSARLIGGQRVKGWQTADGKIFRATLPPGLAPHTLYENGIRARRARFPNHVYNPRFPLSDAPYLTTQNGTSESLVWEKGDLDLLKGIDPGAGATVVVWPFGFADWHKVPRRILGIDSAKRRIELEDLGTNIGKQARFYLEGMRTLLDEPGEFHFDPQTRELSYWPRFGLPDDQEIIAPALLRIFSLEGEGADSPVSQVTIEGFAMTGTNTFPYMTGKTMFPWSGTSDGAHGIIQLRYTQDVAILNNHLRGSGMNGIYLERSNKRDRIYGNWIQDCGISGIVLAYHRESRQFPNDINEDNVIENNRIEGLGSIAVDSAGINIWGGRRNIVRHCVITDGARYGISVRGPYAQLNPGRGQTDMPHTNRPIAEDNHISYTRLARLAQDSGDIGALHFAGISSRSHHPVNTVEQLIIEDIQAHPSMKDAPPNGIYFDYTEGVTDQVMRDIEIRGLPNPFRTNRSDVRHTYDNVSWRDGFDSSRMQRDKIGLLEDFPAAFKGPEEVEDPRVTEVREGETPTIEIKWKNPPSPDISGVWITIEGESGTKPVFVAKGKTSASLPKPPSDRMVMLRLQTANTAGNRSSGVLLPAAEPPGLVGNLVAKGSAGGLQLSWTHPRSDTLGFQVRAALPGFVPMAIPPGTTRANIEGLTDGKVVAVSVDTVDADGQIWPGPEIKAAAGEGRPVPTDAAAWWTFDEQQITENQSIGDESGNGNTLFVTGSGVKPVPGVLEGALELTGGSGYLRLLDPSKLGIGAGGYAVSLWIKRTASTAMGGRIFDFGGGTLGEWEHWGQPVKEVKGGGLTIVSNDYAVGALFHDGERSYQTSAKGLSLPGQWHHLVVNVKRDGDLSLWINGKKVESLGVSGSTGKDLVPSETLFIGKPGSMDHPNLMWPGAVDQLRIYRRALGEQEITALFLEDGKTSDENPSAGPESQPGQ
jgi:hypothetical protein